MEVVTAAAPDPSKGQEGRSNEWSLPGSSPEAQRAFNAQAVAVAESRKAHRLQAPKHPADQARMVRQYQGL